MINFVSDGNIFLSSCQTITNDVNCFGVSGKGLALDFKNKYPNLNTDYVDRYKKRLVKPGISYFFEEYDKIPL
jgi:O-acetyl-ADP-ribose deacetylase (regulator of RNase III)